MLGSRALSGCGCSGFSAPLADIESVQGARFAPMTHQDIKTLQPMLADDLIDCHANGRCETKAQLLESIAPGASAIAPSISCRCVRARRRAP
jgi:hypothetical protein